MIATFTAGTTESQEIDTFQTGEEIVIDKNITRTLLWNVEILHIGIRTLTYEEEFEAREEADQATEEEEVSGII